MQTIKKYGLKMNVHPCKFISIGIMDFEQGAEIVCKVINPEEFFNKFGFKLIKGFIFKFQYDKKYLKGIVTTLTCSSYFFNHILCDLDIVVDELRKDKIEIKKTKTAISGGIRLNRGFVGDNNDKNKYWGFSEDDGCIGII